MNYQFELFPAYGWIIIAVITIIVMAAFAIIDWRDRADASSSFFAALTALIGSIMIFSIIVLVISSINYKGALRDYKDFLANEKNFDTSEMFEIDSHTFVDNINDNAVYRIQDDNGFYLTQLEDNLWKKID